MGESENGALGREGGLKHWRNTDGYRGYRLYLDYICTKARGWLCGADVAAFILSLSACLVIIAAITSSIPRSRLRLFSSASRHRDLVLDARA